MKTACLGAAAMLLAAAGPARAQSSDDAVPGDVFEVQLLPDIGATLGFLGLGLLLERNKASLANDLSCPGPTLASGACSAETVNPIDRWATAMGAETAAAASDVLLLSSLTMPLVFAGVDAAASDRGLAGGERFGRDTVVVLQTYAATYLATNVLKVLAHRLRPFNYDPGQVDRRRDGDSRLSFPSGHTSMAFAGAATLASMLDQRFPAEPWSIGVSVAGFVLASAVGINRVLAGRHFPSDVLVGAAVGTTLGLVIPLLHRSDEPASTTSPAALMVLNWGGQF